MSNLRKTFHSSRFLVLLLGGLILAPSAFADGPSTPRERLQAIAPLVEGRAAGHDMTVEYEQIAASVGVQEKRLALWLQLFTSHGEPGLVSLSEASAIEMAEDVAGTWRMGHRLMNGQLSNQEAWMFHDVVEQRPGFSRIQSLTLEAGILEPALRSDPEDEGVFRLGAFGEVTHQEVSGPKWGLETGESAVLQRFDGELYGVGYPGIDRNRVRSRTEALWVNQAGIYRTVYFDHEFEEIAPDSEFQGLRDPEEPAPRSLFGATETTTIEPDVDHEVVAALESIGGASQVLSYNNFDSVETYLKMSERTLIPNLSAFWKEAKIDDRLLDPLVAMDEANLLRGTWSEPPPSEEGSPPVEDRQPRDVSPRTPRMGGL